MFNILSIGILLFVYATPSLAATVLSEGEKGYVYFDNLTYQNDNANTQFSYIEVNYAEQLDSEDAFNLNLFGNITDTSPYFTLTHHSDPSRFSFEKSIFTIVPDWNDFEGFIEVEVTSGQISIDSIYVSVLDNYQEFGGTYTVTTVPLPASIWLFICGLFILFKNNINRSNGTQKAYAP